MKEIRVSDAELDELLLILLAADVDSGIASDLSHDTKELDAYRKHRKIIKKWIARLQQPLKQLDNLDELEG